MLGKRAVIDGAGMGGLMVAEVLSRIFDGGSPDGSERVSARDGLAAASRSTLSLFAESSRKALRASPCCDPIQDLIAFGRYSEPKSWSK